MVQLGKVAYWNVMTTARKLLQDFVPPKLMYPGAAQRMTPISPQMVVLIQ